MGLFSAFAQELETRRLLMRPWRLSDSEAIRGLWAERDPRSLRVIDAAGRPTVEDIRLRIQEQLEESTRTGLALLAIERKGEGDFVGYCGVIIGASTLALPLWRSRRSLMSCVNLLTGMVMQPRRHRRFLPQLLIRGEDGCGRRFVAGTCLRFEFLRRSDSLEAARSIEIPIVVTWSG